MSDREWAMRDYRCFAEMATGRPPLRAWRHPIRVWRRQRWTKRIWTMWLRGHL